MRKRTPSAQCIFLILFLFLLSSSYGFADEENGEPTEYDQEYSVEEVSIGDQAAPAPEIEQSTMVNAIPLQGRLLSSSGSPLNGTYTITARLYDSSSSGTMLCEDDDSITVTNGLFNMSMDFCNSSDFYGEQVYLGISVDSDPEMTPRTRISPVPYAFNVRPGATIKGGTTYLFVPATAFRLNTSEDTTTWSTAGSRITFSATTIGTKYIRLPITIPGVLYGQNVRVSGMRVYYDCEDGANNYITFTGLYKNVDASASYYTLITDSTNRTSNTPTSYYLSTNTSNNHHEITLDGGFLTAMIGLEMINTSDYIRIAGIRLTLETNHSN